MYTIKEAAARTGVPIALLRAWQRRYGIVEPRRTAAGYRLYDEAALDRIRQMRALVDEGWQPSAAAGAILAGETPTAMDRPGTSPGSIAPVGDAHPPTGSLIETFVRAAMDLDADRLESALDQMFAAGTFELVADQVLLPALSTIGEAWAAGRLDVAGEHAASQAVLRRLSAAFLAAGRPAPRDGSVLVGLPPGGRHELGALAFAIAGRRAGLPILYLGPDLPADDWVATARRTRARVAVIGSPTAVDVGPAVAVAVALRSAEPHLAIAIGGRGAVEVRARLAAMDAPQAETNRPLAAIALPPDLLDAIAAIRPLVGRRARSAARRAGTERPL